MKLFTIPKGGEIERERNLAKKKPYLRGITLQSLHLSALASHLFFALKCVGASLQGNGLQGHVAFETLPEEVKVKGEQASFFAET